MITQESEARTETATFPAALKTHQAMVFSIAYHFLRDRSAAEEVAQDVFLQLHRRFDSLQSDAHVGFWLKKVTSHRCIDYARKRKLQAAVSLDDVAPPSVSGEAADVFLQRRLKALVASLPETPRMVMVLRYQEDLMPEEISSMLEMPVRTVKSHLQRSLALLREKMSRTGARGDLK